MNIRGVRGHCHRKVCSQIWASVTLSVWQNGNVRAQAEMPGLLGSLRPKLLRPARYSSVDTSSGWREPNWLKISVTPKMHHTVTVCPESTVFEFTGTQLGPCAWRRGANVATPDCSSPDAQV